MEKIIYKYETNISRERIVLRLWFYNPYVFLERELTQADGTVLMHGFCVTSEIQLYKYATADPYFRQLEKQYELLQQHFRRIVAELDIDKK